MKWDQEQLNKDAKELEKLGYSQELLRGLSGFSNFAVAFSVVSILTGISQLYGYGLQHGGPSQMFWGWILVGVFTLIVSLSMAELASAYPTAGALYHWSSFLGGRTLGWFTACFNAIGMFAILAGIDYGLAKFLIPLLHLPDDAWVVNCLYAALLLSHAFLNYRGIKIVGWLNDFSAIYHVVVVVVLILALGLKGFRQPLSFLTHFNSTDGFSVPYSFMIGLLLAQWTLTGYDASAHVTEETVDPGRKAPWGIFFAVVLSLFSGLFMLMAVTLSIPDLNEFTLKGDSAFLDIFRFNLGDGFGSIVVGLCAGAMWLCGLAGMTSASRMVYAFARDKGLPFSHLLAKVDEKHKTPAVAIWALATFALILAFSINIYSAVVSIATVALYISYGLPIATRLWARLTRKPEKIGPWNLGRFSTLNSILAVLWVTFITVVFMLPPNEQAAQVMAVFFVILVLLWTFYVRNKYAGPRYHEN
jgi:amino acid transporter